MAKATMLGHGTVGPVHTLSYEHVRDVVAKNASDVEYGDEEDTNEFFLLATGEMAKLGLQVLRDPRPFDHSAADIASNRECAGIWSFSSEAAVWAAFNALTGFETTSGSVFLFQVERDATTRDAS
ncbi:MAG: hypothetical protein WBK28_03585 [Minisyncoccia bacterium]